MLASVYSYRVMVKSVSSCCVGGSRVLSNQVTYDDCLYPLRNQRSTIQRLAGLVQQYGINMA